MSERVFIVDEDVRVREFLYGLITEVGLGALTMPTGSQVLDRLKQEGPGLVILDDTPGEFSGFLLAQKIRAVDPDVDLIMLGLDPQKEKFAPLLREFSVTAYLNKDFSAPETIKEIFLVLKRKNMLGGVSEKSRGNVLVVDDELEGRETVRSFLKRRGFEVDAASSGEECLEKIKMTPFDVILLDVAMTGMDGLLTLKRILDFNPQSKVIMVTALQNRHIIEEAKAIGASDYLVKPFNLETLESSLLSVLLSLKSGSS